MRCYKCGFIDHYRHFSPVRTFRLQPGPCAACIKYKEIAPCRAVWPHPICCRCWKLKPSSCRVIGATERDGPDLERLEYARDWRTGNRLAILYQDGRIDTGDCFWPGNR